MSTSKFRICIIREDGEKVLLHPGAKGERDLVAAIIDSTLQKGIGLFRTEAHVRQDLTDAISEVLFELKSEVVAD